MVSMRRTTQWLLTALLAVCAIASSSLGVTSLGARGLVLGLLVPGACIAAVAFIQRGILSAFMVAAATWRIGVELADRIGNNLHGEVIPLGPFYIAAAFIIAACLGLLGRLALESIRDW